MYGVYNCKSLYFLFMPGLSFKLNPSNLLLLPWNNQNIIYSTAVFSLLNISLHDIYIVLISHDFKSYSYPGYHLLDVLLCNIHGKHYTQEQIQYVLPTSKHLVNSMKCNGTTYCIILFPFSFVVSTPNLWDIVWNTATAQRGINDVLRLSPYLKSLWEEFGNLGSHITSIVSLRIIQKLF